MRKEVPEIGWGDFSFLPSGAPEVWLCAMNGATTRCCVCIILSPEPQEVRLSVRGEGEADCTLVNLLSEDHSHPEKNGKHRILFEPYGYRWFRICGLDYLLKRSAT